MKMYTYILGVYSCSTHLSLGTYSHILEITGASVSKKIEVCRQLLGPGGEDERNVLLSVDSMVCERARSFLVTTTH